MVTFPLALPILTMSATRRFQSAEFRLVTRRHAANSVEELFLNLVVAAHEARNGGAVESAK